MAQDMGSVKRHELEAVFSRIEWLEEEKRKHNASTTSLQHIVEAQDKMIRDQKNRIEDLENRLIDLAGSSKRIQIVDESMKAFQGQVKGMIDDSERHLKTSVDETNRLRRVENDVLNREISGLRVEIKEFNKLNTEMELRQAEESRLSSLLGAIQGRYTTIENRLDSNEQGLSFVGESEQQRQKTLSQVEITVNEFKRRIENISGRVEIFGTSVTKSETALRELQETQAGMTRRQKEWVDQMQLGEYERNQRIENMGQSLIEFQSRMSLFNVEWGRFAEQSKTAQDAVAILDKWKSDMEIYLREATESSRIESNRLQSRWDNFIVEIENRWRTFAVDLEQATSTNDRRARTIETRVTELQEFARDLEKDKNTLSRIQTAQLDAIKELPRLWIMEVEKARSMDPERRREPSLVPIDEEIY
ncbi:MAG: chromosome segregation ATPase [Cellvibrionaceae bacterium]|jgi:chromosome segregation ATPase